MSEEAEKLRALLADFDEAMQPTMEIEVFEAIRRVRDKGTESPPSDEFVAELMAFQFCEDYEDKESGWGTYYGPMIVWPNDDGTTTVAPSIDKVTRSVIDYWQRRASEAKHPVLRTRYADLVWDLSERAVGNRPDHRMAQTVIDSALEIAEKGLDPHGMETNSVHRLERALNLAIALNDTRRVEKVRDAIIAYSDSIAADDQVGTWAFVFDCLCENKKVKKVPLRAAQKEKIIADLEGRLQRLCDPAREGGLNPWSAEAAAIRLANHYRRRDMLGEVRRVLTKMARAYNEIAKSAAPIAACGWLEHVHSIYDQYGLRDEAEATAVELRQLGPKALSQMKRTRQTINIPAEKMQAHVDEMTEGDIETVLARIATQYVSRKGSVQDQLTDLQKTAPLSFLFHKNLLDHEGRTVARVGSLQGDLEGNIAHQMHQNMMFMGVFLREVIEATRRKFDLSADMLLRHMLQSPVFADRKTSILKIGLGAYLAGKFTEAVHLLIPQVEAALRNLLELSGGAALKPNRYGGFHYKTLDDLLREERIVRVFGQDISFYFRVVLTDPRGWNLRNDVCHGISPAEALDATVADRLIHVLLCLAQVRAQAKG